MNQKTSASAAPLKNIFSIKTIALIGVMAAITFTVTYFRFPLMGSKVHFANAFCLLSGMLLGPVPGGLAAGLGSAIYDAFAGYDFINVLITFVSKFAMAWLCGLLVRIGDPEKRHHPVRTVLACLSGALFYVFLYMLKTYIYQRFVYDIPLGEALWATMLSKLIPSLINAAVAVIAAPILWHPILPALRAAGVVLKDEA